MISIIIFIEIMIKITLIVSLFFKELQLFNCILGNKNKKILRIFLLCYLLFDLFNIQNVKNTKSFYIKKLAFSFSIIMLFIALGGSLTISILILDAYENKSCLYQQKTIFLFIRVKKKKTKLKKDKKLLTLKKRDFGDMPNFLLIIW